MLSQTIARTVQKVATPAFPRWSAPMSRTDVPAAAYAVARRIREFGVPCDVETSYSQGYDGVLGKTRYVVIDYGHRPSRIRISDHPHPMSAKNKYGSPDVNIVLPLDPAAAQERVDRWVQLVLFS